MKMEIELTEAQAEKIEILKENNVGVGEAIDMLFEMNNDFVDKKITNATQQKAELEEKLAKVDEELSLFNKLKDGALVSSQKQKIVEKEYATFDKTYDETVQDAKHKFKWSSIL